MKFVLCILLMVSGTWSVRGGEKVPLGVTRDETGMVALLFSGGPDSKLTPRIISILIEHGAGATFAVTGQAVEANPEILKLAAANGFEIANHTWSGRKITGLSLPSLNSEIQRCDDAIAAATGYLPGTFYPPYEATTQALNKRISDNQQLRSLASSLDSFDEKTQSPEVVIEGILKSVKSGDVVLLHDNQFVTAEALPGILMGLFEKGLEPVAASTMIEAREKPDIIPMEDKLRR